LYFQTVREAARNAAGIEYEHYRETVRELLVYELIEIVNGKESLFSDIMQNFDAIPRNEADAKLFAQSNFQKNRLVTLNITHL